MKKALKIVIPLICVLALAAGGAGYYIKTQLESVRSAQSRTYEQYQSLAAQAEACSLTVTENGVEIGTYSLEDLGVLKDAQAKASSQCQPMDAMSAEAFSALPIRQQLAYNEQDHPQPVNVTVPLSAFSADCVMKDLLAVERTPAQNAYVSFENNTFTLHPEQPGNELREDVILGAISECAKDLQFGQSESARLSLEITELDCYRKPEITAENGDFDFDEMLAQKLSQMQIVVGFPDGNEELSAEQIGQIVYLDSENTVCIDRDRVAEAVRAWGVKYNKYNTDFLFDSYLKGIIPIAKVRVSYILDEPALSSSICDQLLKLEPVSLPAPVQCQTPDGEPFDIADDHIEIDIDNQKLTVFRSGQPVISTDVVTGALVFRERVTITGLYYAYCMETNVTMTNITADNPNPADPYSVFSQYFIGIEGEYGIHDASWRTHFGGEFYVNAGSHGCVNVPCEAMPTIWDNAYVGIPILIHGKNEWFQVSDETNRILWS